MHKLNYDLHNRRHLTCPPVRHVGRHAVCWLWHPEAERSRLGGTERKISMKCIALVYVTPLFSLLSLSKLGPDVSSSFHPRGAIVRMRERGCVRKWERESGRGKSERDMMVGKRQRRANGFLWPRMETGIRPNDFIPSSVSHPSISPGLQSQNTSSLLLPSTVTVNQPLY